MLRLPDIELFLTFADAQNATEAAAKLNISQPTFCDRLKDIESRLPQNPFSWRGHKRVLSPFGQKMAAELRPHAANLRRAVRSLTADDETLSSFPVRVCGRIEPLSRLAQAAEAELRLILSPCSSQTALDRLLAGEIDLAITHVRPTQKDLVIFRLFEPSISWICSPKLSPPELHRVTIADNSTPWNTVLDLPWLAYRENDPLLEFFAEHTGLAAVRQLPWLLIENWHTIRDLVALGKGVAVVPREAVDESDNSLARLKRIDFPNANRSGTEAFYAVYRKEMTHSANGKKLMAALRRAFPQGSRPFQTAHHKPP
jgi:DNA-binding transcriptional LysR family regulator